MEGIPLKRRKIDDKPDFKLCIICQKKTDQVVASQEQGRCSILHAANIKQDIVYQRLLTRDSSNFCYHMTNECYKNYTHSKSLKTISRKRKAPEASASASSITRSQSKPRDAPSGSVKNENVKWQMTCVLCGCRKGKGKDGYEKFRISESDRAAKFLQATIYFQDEVYRRTCDLQDINAVFGADLYCHKNCIRNYFRSYDRAIANESSDHQPSEKQKAFDELIKSIDPCLNKGEGFTLSTLRERANTLVSIDNTFSHKELKVLLHNQYGNRLCTSKPNARRKSGMIFLNSITTEEMAETIRENDPIITCARAIRESLLSEDFHLDDRFCDSSDLEEAWKNMTIPPTLLKFMGALFNFNPQEFSLASEDENGDDEVETSTVSEQKKKRMSALHQIMFYNVHNGKHRTPLHLMNSQVIHETCKSKTLIKGFNKFGLAMSYDELLRYHNDMSGYMIEKAQNNVPLPSHFDPEMFTIGAFDNFDHEEATESGIGGSHDTVSVLFQDKPDKAVQKPNISDTSIAHGQFGGLKQELSCQKICDYVKPSKKPDISDSFIVPDELYTMNDTKLETIKRKEVAWALGRSNVQPELVQCICENQTMPSWTSFNSLVSEADVPEKIVGFIPLIPYPVTEYSTVYTALKNFQNILGQLKQSHMAVTCDEGVYHIAREIMLQRPNEFSNIVLCIGSFHMIKVMLGCIGKYLRGSGAENIWVESGIFGVNVVESVLNGTNYIRSLRGMYMLSDVMERMLWREFFKVNGTSKYKDELSTLQRLKEAVGKTDRRGSQDTLESFLENSGALIEDFEKFKKEQCDRSETFSYWTNFIALVSLLKNLVRADREGNWELHLQTVQAILPLFAVFDRTNYLRWCSLYIEDMRMLPLTAPDIHQAFLQGKFVVQRTPGRFKAVGADMCLEQTINRSMKSKSGIIGSSKRKTFVTEWEMIYHEMLAVSNLYRELNGCKVDNSLVSHEFTKSETDANEKKIESMATFIESHENPFDIEAMRECKLHNILTQEIMPDEVRNQLLHFQDTGIEKYTQFRNDRYIAKTKRLSDRIPRVNLKTFRSIKDDKKPQTKKKKAQKVSLAQKVIDIARVRGCDMREIFKHDLYPTTCLLDDEGLMTKPNKSTLCTELEKSLSAEDYRPPSDWEECSTTYIFDVMACLRRTRTKNLQTFGELCESMVSMALSTSKNASRIDFVFDSYVEGSVKDSERARRATVSAIEISTVSMDTPLPVAMDTFWSSGTNKAKLQKLLTTWIKTNRLSHWPDIVLSGMTCPEDLDDQICQLLQQETISELPDLDLSLEEADVRLFPHALHATVAGAKRICLVTSDTDVLVLALHYWVKLHRHGLCELWMRGGIGDTTRYIPVHTLATQSGQLCKVLPAMHSLTGCDITSKFGTKAAAIKANPTNYLQGFGQNPNSPNMDQVLTRAEEYLVQVLKPGSRCKTMDELRYQIYHQSKATTIEQLPPTSSATTGHILRSYYSAYIQMHCITGNSLDPKMYGYVECEHDGQLIPDPSIQTLPEDLALSCNCVKCATKRCECRRLGVPCCVFCKCQPDKSACKNPNIMLHVPLQTV